MEVQEIKSEGLSREYSVTLPAKDIENKISERLKEIAQTAHLPGFRPGKVPVSLLKKRFGPSIMGEILEKAVNSSSQQALTEKGIRPASQPEIELTSFEDGKDVEYSIKLEIIPEIKPIDFNKIKLERLIPTSKDEDIEKALINIAKSQKTSVPTKRKRKSKLGDILVIDFAGSINGEEFTGGKAEDYKLELGSNSFIPGFEDQLVSKNKNDRLNVLVTFPSEYGSNELAGKEASFDVLIKDIEESVPAEIDDELAKKLGLESLETLKEAIAEEQSQEFKQMSRLRMKRNLMDILSDLCDFDTPPKMVDSEFDAIWKQYEEQNNKEDKGKKSDVPDDVEIEQQKAEFRKIAVRRVSVGLLMSEVGRENNIKITQEDISQAINSEAKKYPGEEQKIIEYYQNNSEAAQQLSAPVYEEKVVDFILEMAKIEEKKVSTDEFMKILEEDARDEETKKNKTTSKTKKIKRSAKKSKK